jgi:hypothetical protein
MPARGQHLEGNKRLTIESDLQSPNPFKESALPTPDRSVHAEHALRFLRERWLKIERVVEVANGVHVYMAVPRHPRIAALVTGGHFNDRQLLGSADCAALEHLRTFARDRGIQAVHIESLVNSAGHSEVLETHFIP